MSLTEGVVTGWMPSYGDDDDVDISNTIYPVKVPDDFRLSPPILSRTSSNDSYSHYSQSSDYPPSSPDSSVDHTDNSYTDLPTSSLSSSDRRAIRNRLRDPDWVPRPRNAFIIFRCEYSRKHARDPSDPSDRSSRCDKTLSKRAGEEWRRSRTPTIASSQRVVHPPGCPPTRRVRVRVPAGATTVARGLPRLSCVASAVLLRPPAIPVMKATPIWDLPRRHPLLLVCSAGAVLPRCHSRLLRGRRTQRAHSPRRPDPSHAYRARVWLQSTLTCSRAAR